MVTKRQYALNKFSAYGMYIHELHISSSTNQSHQGHMGMTPQYANPHDDIPQKL
jgi:hypothetical protein